MRLKRVSDTAVEGRFTCKIPGDSDSPRGLLILYLSESVLKDGVLYIVVNNLWLSGLYLCFYTLKAIILSSIYLCGQKTLFVTCLDEQCSNLIHSHRAIRSTCL